jgi:hypothetical protein
MRGSGHIRAPDADGDRPRAKDLGAWSRSKKVRVCGRECDRVNGSRDSTIRAGFAMISGARDRRVRRRTLVQ